MTSITAAQAEQDLLMILKKERRALLSGNVEIAAALVKEKGACLAVFHQLANQDQRCAMRKHMLRNHCLLDRTFPEARVAKDRLEKLNDIREGMQVCYQVGVAGNVPATAITMLR